MNQASSANRFGREPGAIVLDCEPLKSCGVRASMDEERAIVAGRKK